jgi:hypothetical protein
MNYPSISFILVCIVMLSACPSQQPSKDDTSEPADGETGDAATCEGERRRLQAELDECRAPK